MLTAAEIPPVLDAHCASAARQPAGDHPDAPAALPDAALDFLVALARDLRAQRVFEFGSGRSTAAFLRAGLAVVSLEDSTRWMQQTLDGLTAEERTRHTGLVRPLRLRWHGCAPVMDWRIDAALAAHLAAADLILVDSPYYAPFREATLWSALRHNGRAVVVLDDTRIPTLARVCERLAGANPGLLHSRVSLGHGFDLFSRLDTATPLRRAQSPLEVLKAWRRFLLSRRTA